MLGGVVHVLDTYDLSHEYKDTLKSPPGLMHLFGELHIALCGKEVK